MKSWVIQMTMSLVTVVFPAAAQESGDSSSPDGVVVSEPNDPTDAAASSEEAAAESPAPEPVSRCLEVHEQAQVARMDGDFLTAEQLLSECSSPVCPDALRRDCLSWKEEARAGIPTVLVIALGDEGDIVDAQVFLDGVEVRRSLDGRPLRANPGTRFVRVVLPDGRGEERRVVLSEGEKSRRIEFDFRTAPGAEPGPENPVLEESVVFERPVPLVTYVMGGIAVVSAGVAVGFGIDAYVKRNRARDTCAPVCGEDVSEALSSRAAVADVAWGTAATAAIIGTVLYVFRPTIRETVARNPTRPWLSEVSLSGRLDQASFQLRGEF